MLMLQGCRNIEQGTTADSGISNKEQGISNVKGEKMFNARLMEEIHWLSLIINQ
jgi:hypothetical protein